MKRFEIIYHEKPHPSRSGCHYTINIDGRIMMSDSKPDCIKACAAFLADTDDTAARPSVDEMIQQHNIDVVKIVQRAMGMEL